MEQFWLWLSRANARAVLRYSVAALLVVSAWWGRKLLGPDRGVDPIPTQTVGQTRFEDLALPAYLAQQAKQDAESHGDPFMWKFRDMRPGSTMHVAQLTPPPPPEPPIEKPAPPPEPRIEKPAPQPTPKVEMPKPPPPAPKPPPPPAPPKPPPQIVNLKYRGMMVRPDGVKLALIEDQLKRASKFYPLGSRMYGLELRSIEMTNLTFRARDYSTLSLGIGHTNSVGEVTP